jgi:hypothetical protein
MTAKWEGDGRRAMMEEMAEEARSEEKYFFYVRIPGDIQPIERAERFEDPLDAALREADLGSVTGGGSQTGEGARVEYCGVDVVVIDRSLGIDLICRVMQSLGCPQGAVIEEYLPEYSEFPIWPN